VTFYKLLTIQQQSTVHLYDIMIQRTDLQMKDMVSSYKRKLISEFPKQRNAFIACDMVLFILAMGEKEKALEFATKLVEENKKDPITTRQTDEKSKRINLTYAICQSQEEK
jgi:hypothetical protein